jgi:hypothetical protein
MSVICCEVIVENCNQLGGEGKEKFRLQWKFDERNLVEGLEIFDGTFGFTKGVHRGFSRIRNL